MTGIEREIDGKKVCIGIERFPYRKKYGLGVKIGNVCTKVATFNNVDSARFFMNKLCAFVGIAPIDWNGDDIPWGLQEGLEVDDNANG